MKRILTFLLALSLSTVGYVTQAQAKPIALKLVTAWPSNYWTSANFLESVAAMNKALEGKVSIEYKGGPEVVRGPKMGEAVRTGMIDIAYLAMGYTSGTVPATYYGVLSPNPPWVERENGTLDYWNKIYADKLGAYCLGRFGWPIRFYFFMGKKNISKPDFSGLKIRCSSALEPIITNLGGARIAMSVSEIYTAMDRGVIDGYGTAFIGTRDFSLQEVTKYIIDHPFWHTETKAIINLKKWESLPNDVREFVLKVMSEEERRNSARVEKDVENERAELKKAGLRFMKFTTDDAKHFYKIIEEGGWGYASKYAPQHEAEFRKLFSQ